MMNKIRNINCSGLGVLYAAFIASFILLSSSSATSASWNPEDTLETFLMDNYPWEEIEVRNVKVIGTLHSDPPERIIVEKGPLGKAVFSFVSGDERKTIVKAHVQAFGNVVKSKRPLRRKHVMEGEDIYLRRKHVMEGEDIYLAKVDIRKIPNGSMSDPEKIVGKSLKRSIAANIPIQENMVQMSRVVGRGMRVNIIVSSNGLNIRATGRTNEKGYVGQPVRVMNLSSKKIISGILVDEKTVKVEL
jgi:flagella basal body P-ring formation protein FlgA